jgi:hypothetical protein
VNRVVCGAFSSSPEKSKASGEAIDTSPPTVYTELLRRNDPEGKQLPEGVRMDLCLLLHPTTCIFLRLRCT